MTKHSRQKLLVGEFLGYFSVIVAHYLSIPDDLDKTFFDYKSDWKFIDELANRDESPISDWVTADAYADVHQELRRIVDGFMRIELELLRVALTIDTKTRYAPPKPKKPKKEKKRKSKSIDDVTEGRSLEECYDELKALNVSLLS